MAWTTQIGNYVKFLRGTPAAWESLLEKDSDTLYFISEENANRGKLYLGEKLISDGFQSSINTLEDLQDVLISNGIPTNALLMYDTTDHKWKPQSLSTIYSLLVRVMTGATENSGGTSGLVPAPAAGDNTKYLRGDGTWVNPTAQLESTIGLLVGDDTGKSIRQIASSEVAKLINGAPEAYDTLGELYDWISTHDSIIDVQDATNRLEAVETAVFGNDNDVNGLVNDVTEINTDITNIKDTLRWKDLVQE